MIIIGLEMVGKWEQERIAYEIKKFLEEKGHTPATIEVFDTKNVPEQIIDRLVIEKNVENSTRR
jgi:hypothetical protein